MKKSFVDWANHYGREFKNIFGFSMPYDFTGINLFKFENILNIPEDESIEEYVERNYGTKGINLIREIIENPPEFPK